MPPLDATQLLAHIKSLADEAAAAATAAIKVDFGTGVQPQNRVLNAWQTLGLPAAAMQAMHASGLSTLDSIGIYVTTTGDPDPDALLLALCKKMDFNKTDAAKIHWASCDFADNLIVGHQTAQWWSYAMRTLLQRVKAVQENNQRTAIMAEKHPNSAPLVPKGDRAAQYSRIEAELPFVWEFYNNACDPHHRILDKLDHCGKLSLQIPVWEVTQMWLHDDPIVTDLKNEAAFSPTESFLFAIGTDRITRTIVVHDWDTFRKRMLSFSVAMGLTGHAALSETRTKMNVYLKLLEERFREAYSMRHIIELDLMIRKEISKMQKKNRVLSFFGALDEYVLDDKKGAAHLSYLMATVLYSQSAGRSRGGGGPAAGGGAPDVSPSTPQPGGTKRKGDNSPLTPEQKIERAQRRKDKRKENKKKGGEGGAAPKAKAKAKAKGAAAAKGWREAAAVPCSRACQDLGAPEETCQQEALQVCKFICRLLGTSVLLHTRMHDLRRWLSWSV